MEQWFSIDKITGYGLATNADLLMASTTARNGIFDVKVCP